mgnify:CR=1 FL=1
METTTNKGIDYGMGQSNIDVDNGIRYGVIHQNEVGQAWFDESEPIYFYHCPKCDLEIGNEFMSICPDRKSDV